VSVTGDVNVAMVPGPGKQIIWNVAADYPGNLWPQVVAKVMASDVSGRMVFVPTGNFTMGSATGESSGQPVHMVYLDAFYIDIDKCEVANAQFKSFIDAG
jgi:formylglycine-generating enzyme required for sulfatase activity